MESLTDIQLQKIFAYSDEVCARDLLEKQFNILGIQETVIPTNIVGSTIEVPLKFIKLIDCLIKCHYPNLGITLKEKQVHTTAEQLPLMEPSPAQDHCCNVELTQINETILLTEFEEAISIIEIQNELKNLRLDSKKNCDDIIHASNADTNKINNNLLNIDKNILSITEKLQETIISNKIFFDLVGDILKDNKISKSKQENRNDFYDIKIIIKNETTKSEYNTK